MRIVAWVLVAVMASLPAVQTAGATAAPEACPMAAHAPTNDCCVFAPCPCEHSAPDATVPAMSAAVACEVACTPRPVDSARPHGLEPLAALQDGHPRPIEHPPSRHA